MVAVGTWDGSLRVIDVKLPKVVRHFPSKLIKNEERIKGHSRAIRSVQFSHDGNYLVTGSADGSSNVYSVFSYAIEHSSKFHEGPLAFAAFLPPPLDPELAQAIADGRKERSDPPKPQPETAMNAPAAIAQTAPSEKSELTAKKLKELEDWIASAEVAATAEGQWVVATRAKSRSRSNSVSQVSKSSWRSKSSRGSKVSRGSSKSGRGNPGTRGRGGADGLRRPLRPPPSNVEVAGRGRGRPLRGGYRGRGRGGGTRQVPPAPSEVRERACTEEDVKAPNSNGDPESTKFVADQQDPKSDQPIEDEQDATTHTDQEGHELPEGPVWTWPESEFPNFRELAVKGPSFRGVPEPLQPVEEEVSELELEEAQSFSEPSLSPRPRIQQHAEYASYLPLVTASGDRSVSLWNKGANELEQVSCFLCDGPVTALGVRSVPLGAPSAGFVAAGDAFGTLYVLRPNMRP